MHLIQENYQALSEASSTVEDATLLGGSLPGLFEQAVEKHANTVAVACGEEKLTFSELNGLANQFAKLLRKKGVQNGDIVGVALDRSARLVALLLGVMKTGAAYIPVDPSLPPERINQMLDDACPKIFITDQEALLTSTAWTDVCLSLNDFMSILDHNSSNLELQVDDQDLIYVMYTSGSTGRPKGVEVTHGSVANLLLSLKRDPGCKETDRLLAITTVSFDMAVVELFLPLICGATTVIAQQHEIKDPPALIELMRRHNITIMQGTPALWQMLLDSGWQGEPQLQKIFCGGEALTASLANRLLDCGRMMWNMYGPTEVTVYGSIWQVQRDQAVLIGSPLTNGRLYVLDKDSKPLPHGQAGELYIGGAGVARGYRNNPELTASRFLPNPFHDGSMYRTGDLARLMESGEVHLLGRIDGQVKIRGYRIEVGEVEAAILEHEVISGAVVVCRDERLVAYCVPRRAIGKPLQHILRPWLAERLPAYMVPAFFVPLDVFPVTPNGKVDRKALPDPVSVLRPEAGNISTDRLERQLIEIWAKVLGHDCISVDDNFFEIGGDSARLIRVQKELSSLLGRVVPSPILFEYYTIRGLATHLRGKHQIPTLIPEVPQLSATDDIAIVSMSCRLPGGVETPDDFWELLERGGDAIVEVPKDRWDAEAIYASDPQTTGKSYCRSGGFLSSIHAFDVSFFGISPREASSLDPAQYLMLETCWEGFERAGYTTSRLRGSQTGVYIGTSNILGHIAVQGEDSKTLETLDGYTVTGSAGGTMSGRIAYHLGLQGPVMTVDTACSSSLVATHLACSALRQGECDVAVAGGVSLLTNPGLHVEFSRLQGMSPDGRCRAFSQDTEGTGWAEGAAAVVLKRLSDAKRDGDRIHAVIRGSAVNHDGRAASLTTPSGAAQERLVRSALTRARLQPRDIDYVEAHGTGTKLGDPIEAAALAEVFGSDKPGQPPLLVGSVKSNIGHTQAAAGLAGLIKCCLAMQNQTLPETLHVSTPTVAVDWKGSNMLPVMEKQAWVARSYRPRRAGVSAFGIGGTNAHIILEEAPAPVDTPTASLPGQIPFLLSAQTGTALSIQAKKLHAHLTNEKMHEGSLLDVAYSLATSRHHFRQRLSILAGNKDELLDQLQSTAESISLDSSININPKLAMLFTGQGSQWPGMGKDLADAFPLFLKAVTEIAAMFTLETPLLDVMWNSANSAEAAPLTRTEYAQPALFTLEVALYRLWQSWGVKPDYVMGHSLGEIVAAHVAGVMDLQDACRLVETRSRLMQAAAGDYMMVSLDADGIEVDMAVEQYNTDHNRGVDVALYNTPTRTVISGTTEGIQHIEQHFANMGHKTRTIFQGHAFHSRYMDPVLKELRAMTETIQFRSPQIPIISNLEGSLVQPGQLEDPEYWVRQVREPVRFSKGVQELARHGVNVFLEVGPRPVLCGMGAESVADHPSVWLSSLDHRKDSVAVMQRGLTELHVQHIPTNWEGYFLPFHPRRVELPTYAFQRDFVAKADAPYHKARILEASRPTLDAFQFEVSWQPAEPRRAPFKQTWGVWSSANSSWSKSVRNHLTQGGVLLIEVQDLQQGEDFDGILCLWDTEDDDIRQAQPLVAKALEQLQIAAKLQLMTPIVWATHRAVGTGTEDKNWSTSLATAPLWGMMRSARSEYPELKLRLLDLDDNKENLVLALTYTEPECALRQSQLLVPRLRKAAPQLLSPLKTQVVRTDGAVLITGGLGHLGSHVALWLARHHGVRDLVLTSRHGIAAPDAKALLAELSTFDAEVTVFTGDISENGTVTSLMALFSDDRPLRGVVHAAGVADSGVLSSLTPQRCATTLEPKVYGAWLLHEATKSMDLDIFVMFSSISGVVGMPGLANYAAANTFLDALAHQRRTQSLPATSIAYGTWGGDGMAARLGETAQAHLAQYGLNSLVPEDGLELLGKAIQSSRALTVAASLDLIRMHEYFHDQGGIPPLLSSLLVRQERRTQDWDLPTQLHNSAPEKHQDIVLQMVQRVVAKVLGYARPLELNVDSPLGEIGIDSLTAVQMRNQLATLTGLSLSVNMAFLYPNLRTLAQSLLAQLRDTDSSSAATTSSATSDTSVSEPCLDMAAIRKGCLDSTLTFGNVDRGDIHVCPTAVFLTGATGFVGAHILYELLKRGIRMYCLVRAESDLAAHQRLIETMQSYDLWADEFEFLVKTMAGDMAQPFLGLSEDDFDDLSNQVDAICHSGALVQWMQPLEQYVGPNIVSTHEILRLASRGRPKAVHLVSTISTLPLHMGLNLVEGDQEYGYGTSKYLAEKLLAAARWRGARGSAYRLPYVTASARTGHFRRDKGDFLHNLVVGALELGAFPALDADMSAVLPIDYLSQTIVDVMTRDQGRIGHDYDFLDKQALTCNQFFKMLSKAGSGGEVVPFGEWKRRALERAVAQPKGSLARISAIIDGYTELTAAEMFKGGPVGAHVFGGEDFPAPTLSEEAVRSYLGRIRS